MEDKIEGKIEKVHGRSCGLFFFYFMLSNFADLHNLRKNRCQGVQNISLNIHSRMHISIEGNIDICVSQQLADTFDICTLIDAVGRKRMTKGVKMCEFHTSFT